MASSWSWMGGVGGAGLVGWRDGGFLFSLLLINSWMVKSTTCFSASCEHLFKSGFKNKKNWENNFQVAAEENTWYSSYFSPDYWINTLTAWNLVQVYSPIGGHCCYCVNLCWTSCQFALFKNPSGIPHLFRREKPQTTFPLSPPRDYWIQWQ